MQIGDKVYDKDAYINGVVIGKNDDHFKVLWDNDVLGSVNEDIDDSLEISSDPNIKVYLIEDILHTGHHGPEDESKVGAKYDDRRGKMFVLDTSELEVGEPAVFKLYNKKDIDDSDNNSAVLDIPYQHLYTTIFEKIYEEDGYTMFRTLNSIYKLKDLGNED